MINKPFVEREFEAMQMSLPHPLTWLDYSDGCQVVTFLTPFFVLLEGFSLHLLYFISLWTHGFVLYLHHSLNYNNSGYTLTLDNLLPSLPILICDWSHVSPWTSLQAGTGVRRAHPPHPLLS